MTDRLDCHIRRVRSEHAELESLARGLRGLLADGQREGWPAADREAVAAALEKLTEHLQLHFAQEEEGYMEEALALAPKFSSEAAQLLRQHAVLFSVAVDLCERARREQASPAGWPRMAAQVADLLQQIAAHEAAESHIVQHAFNVDLELAE